MHHSHLSSPSDPHPLLSFKPTHCISATMKLFHFVRSSMFSHPWVFPFTIFSLWILSSPFPGRLVSYHLNFIKKNVFSDPLVKVRCLAVYPYHILYPPMITFVTLSSGLFCCDVCQLDSKLPEGRDHAPRGALPARIKGSLCLQESLPKPVFKVQAGGMSELLGGSPRWVRPKAPCWVGP